MTTMTTASETFTIREEIRVRASLEKTFESLLAEMGARNQSPDGKPLPMVIEPRPGGRWFRDLGGENGHLWGFVQSIKRPVLLEIWGPLFMSTAASSNLMYRLSESEGTRYTRAWPRCYTPVQKSARTFPRAAAPTALIGRICCGCGSLPPCRSATTSPARRGVPCRSARTRRRRQALAGF